MKTKNILLTVALIFSLSPSIHAQTDEDGFLEGIQSSLSNMFDTTNQHAEAGRLFMLFTNDISMTMKAHNDGEVKDYKLSDGFYFHVGDSVSDASMTAEFDWDNKALSMHLKKTKNKETYSLTGGMILGETTNEAIDHYQYTDKEGYWYVPYEVPPYRTRYIKFNAKQAAQDRLELLSEITSEIIENEIVEELKTIWETLGSGPLLIELFQGHPVQPIYDLGLIVINNFSNTLENTESNTNEISQLLNEEYLSLVGFPVFIHWALIYSPDVIRANYNVTQTAQDCYNIPNGCTKLTIASGKDRGKYMMFDQYNRLIYIDSKKEGSVIFDYSRDLTVKLPPAIKYNDFINSQLNRRN